MSMSEGWSLLLGNWFVTTLIIVHAVMLLGFFVFILTPNKKGARLALTVALFGVCGGCIALASGRELVALVAGL